MKDIYVKFTTPNVEGESQDKDHAGWIEVSTWSQRIIQPRSKTASTAGGHSSERAEHAPIVITKEEDVTSPLLYQYASGGQTFDEVVIEFYRADGEGNRVKYKEVKLKHAMIQEIYSTAGEGALPTDVIAIKYAAIQWTHTKQKIGGNQSGKTQGAWSLTKNDKTYAV
ncbi:MAG: type VI secretion system tube protein Hcp [Burkholderiales bacterium]|jgi:type VI secretion system secreted protein Hcp|nr:type VI secretion system tube protein Hcp [Burkholderiales bacterium]